MRTRILTIAAVLLSLSAVPAADDSFVPLVDGPDVQQFELVKLPADSIAIAGDEIRLTGTPNGYFATRKMYRNYVLRFEWMYERPAELASEAAFQGNSGLLLHIQEPHKVWPQSIEVQLFNADAGNIFAIFGSKFEGKKDAAAQKRAIKPVGEWNAEEVTCKEGQIICTINGIEVARGKGASPDQGSIGWQSEGAPIRFRKIQIRVLD